MQWYQRLRQRQSSLAFQLRYGVVGLVSLSVLLVAILLITFSIEAHFQEVLEVQQVRAQAVSHEIESYVYELQGKLGYLSRVQGFSTLSLEAQQAMIEGLTRQNEAYETILILDSQGQLQAETSAYGLYLTPEEPEVLAAFERIFYRGEDYVGDVTLLQGDKVSPEEPLPVVLLGVPIHNRQDKIDGILLAYINLRFLWTLVQNTQVGQTGYSYVVDTRNQVIAQSRRSSTQHQFQLLADEALVEQLRTMAGFSLDVMNSGDASLYRGLNHQRVVGAAAPIAGVNWLTIVEMPLPEVAKSSYQLLLVLVVMLLVLTTIAAIVSMLFTRQLVQPLQQLTRAVTVLSYGTLNVRVPMSQLAELGVLALAFNRMASRLQQMVQDLRIAKNSAEVTLSQLKKTQAHLVQSEKLSGLGRMVAGIAHELNNPVTFIHTNTDYLNTYTKDLISLVALYQKIYPDTHPEIVYKLDEIEFDFLQEDIFKVLQSMQVGTERITGIVNSMRVFSRLDETGIKPVNLHQCLDSTLLVLNSRLSGSGKCPAIKVLKDYGDLPSVLCDAGQLNQVFINILENAIDAIQEGYDAAKGSAPPTISIRTRSYEKTVTITLADNGPGMSEAHRQQIFDPFFTTKPVGQGTGLGLSVSYQIVSETHNGTLTCTSELGQGTVFEITLPDAIA